MKSQHAINHYLTFWGALMTPILYPNWSDPKIAVNTERARVPVTLCKNTINDYNDENKLVLESGFITLPMAQQEWSEWSEWPRRLQVQITAEAMLLHPWVRCSSWIASVRTHGIASALKMYDSVCKIWAVHIVLDRTSAKKINSIFYGFVEQHLKC